MKNHVRNHVRNQVINHMINHVIFLARAIYYPAELYIKRIFRSVLKISVNTQYQVLSNNSFGKSILVIKTSVVKFVLNILGNIKSGQVKLVGGIFSIQ